MGSTHSALYFHLVWATKYRRPIMSKEWRQLLFDYLAGCIRTAGGTSIIVNGIEDHVHALARLRPPNSVSDIMRDIKGPSSRWVHQDLEIPKFGWQDGFGAYSVSPSQVPRVKAYIANQEQHHKRLTFEREYLAMLEKCGMEYDPRYLWDPSPRRQ